MNYFITAIHTDSGKTLASAIVCEALRADYWKPIQAGSPFDSQTIKELITNDKTLIHPEAYALKHAESPHAAAKREGKSISMNEIMLPATSNHLVIEGAGGCLVPLNDTNFVIDIAVKFKAPVILVSNFYLGSINHTLLTFEALMKRNIQIEGIIFNGARNEESEKVILNYTSLKCLLHIEKETKINKHVIKHYALKLNENWKL